jgi:hypothetical protein
MTECKEPIWLFQDLGKRKVEVDFGVVASLAMVAGLYYTSLSAAMVCYRI